MFRNNNKEYQNLSDDHIYILLPKLPRCEIHLYLCGLIIYHLIWGYFGGRGGSALCFFDIGSSFLSMN